MDVWYKGKRFFLDFLNFLIGLHFLWYTNLFWSGRCCFSLVLEWTLLLLSCSGVDVAASLLLWSGCCCFSLVMEWTLMLLSCYGVDVAASLLFLCGRCCFSLVLEWTLLFPWHWREREVKGSKHYEVTENMKLRIFDSRVFLTDYKTSINKLLRIYF